MNPKSLVYLILGSLLAAALFIGCGNDEGGPVNPYPMEVIVKAVASTPDTADIVHDPLWDGAEEASIPVGTDENYSNYHGSSIVKVKAMQDGEYLYVMVNWADLNKTVTPGRWIYGRTENTAFTQVLDTVKNTAGNFGYNEAERNRQLWENEDVVSLFFDMDDGGSVGANCALTCHVNDADTTLVTHFTQGNGTIDAWVWRSGRTDPFGVAEDYLWTDNSKYDGFDVPLYTRNALTASDLSDPRVMHTTGSDFKDTILLAQDTIPYQLITVPAWENFDAIPGYIHYSDFNSGTNTSRYDVRAKSEYDPQLGRWTVVMWRKMQAPHSDDANFVEGESKEATLAIMKNTLIKHSGSKVFTFKF